MVDIAIKSLLQYGFEKGLIQKEDFFCCANRLIEALELDAYGEPPEGTPLIDSLEEILEALLDDAQNRGILKTVGTTGRDLLDAKLMGCITPPPSEVTHRFSTLYAQNPEDATDFYYAFSQDTDYIRRYRQEKNVAWKADTPYGMLDITINLAKPEKDPAEIAAAGRARQTGYPKCLLCPENEGYAGRADHPARQNHRMIPVTLDGQPWFLQYSPYVYYNEHCIVLNKKHVPMKIDKSTYIKLFDFVRQFPHYFVGSNADLPIVGGSILSHDHFQGGRYEFPMARASREIVFAVNGFEDVEAHTLQWPMFAIRLTAEDGARLVEAAGLIERKWREYSDEKAFIFAYTEGVPHNTVTPIARKAGGKFQIDLVLRNNITTEEHPLGVFHPHAELHHIKKENIGLIEVMGLAVLPARLKREMDLLEKAILQGKDLKGDEALAPHAQWAETFMQRYGRIGKHNIAEILKAEIGRVFLRVLEDAGVYKRTPEGRAAAGRFLDTLR